MRAAWTAALLDARAPRGPDIAAIVDLLVGLLSEHGYCVWGDTIPKGYPLSPTEVLRAEAIARGPFALVRVHGGSAAIWAQRLCAHLAGAPVVLFYGPDIDQVPGVGPVRAEGPDGQPALKIYLDGVPALKVGSAPDEEVAWAVPALGPERLAAVDAAIRQAFGAAGGAVCDALAQAVERPPQAAALLQRALDLPPRFGAPEASLVFLQRDSLLYLNASIT